jgi:hypothetical protein
MAERTLEWDFPHRGVFGPVLQVGVHTHNFKNPPILDRMYSKLAKRCKITQKAVLSEILWVLVYFDRIFRQFVQKTPPFELPRPALKSIELIISLHSEGFCSKFERILDTTRNLYLLILIFDRIAALFVML